MAEAAVIFGLVTGSIELIKTCKDIYTIVKGEKRLPSSFRAVAEQLPFIEHILVSIETTYKENRFLENEWIATKSELQRCHEDCKELNDLFMEVVPEQGASKIRQMMTAADTVLHRKGEKANDILLRIQDALSLFGKQSAITNTKLLDEIKLVLEEMQKHNNAGHISQQSGTQNNNMGGSGHFTNINNEASGNARQTNFFKGDTHNYPTSNPPFTPKFLNEPRINYESFKSGLNPRPADNTCLWVFNNDEYIRWRDNTSAGLFWLFAPPQRGKSVISRILIDKVLPESLPRAQIFHFFFKDNEEQNDITIAMRAMLIQFFRLNGPSFYSILKEELDTNEDLKTDFESMWSVFLKLIQASEADTTICVLDGLDECESSQRKVLIGKLNDFHLDCQSLTSAASSLGLRFFVSSRPYDMSERLKGIHLNGDCHTNEIEAEIQGVLKVEMQNLGHQFALRSETRDTALRLLSAKRNRTYLWLKYILLDLADNFGRVETVTCEEFIEIIANLPESVEQAYEKILSRCTDQQNVLTLLKMIAAAPRPLSLGEIDAALISIAPTTTPADVESRMKGLEGRKVYITNHCKGFVDIVSEKIHFIHSTAKEFLQPSKYRSIQLAGEGLWGGSLDIKSSNAELAERCMKFLIMMGLGYVCDDISAEIDEIRAEMNQFYLYAKAYWRTHLQLSESDRLSEMVGEVERSQYSSLFSGEIVDFGEGMELTWNQNKG